MGMFGTTGVLVITTTFTYAETFFKRYQNIKYCRV